jgi:hypothetical protein
LVDEVLPVMHLKEKAALKEPNKLPESQAPPQVSLFDRRPKTKLFNYSCCAWYPRPRFGMPDVQGAEVKNKEGGFSAKSS